MFELEEERKETDFLGYRGMKTSSSTQLLSRLITASLNACNGHEYTSFTQRAHTLYDMHVIVYLYILYVKVCHLALPWLVYSDLLQRWNSPPSVCDTHQTDRLTDDGTWDPTPAPRRLSKDRAKKEHDVSVVWHICSVKQTDEVRDGVRDCSNMKLIYIE